MSYRPPALPLAPKAYDADYINYTHRILTQYLEAVRLNNFSGALAFPAYIDFHKTGADYAPARLSWNDTYGTPAIGMGLDSVLQHIGMDQYFPPVYNGTATTITKGSVVAFSGVISGGTQVGLHIANGTIPSLYTVGVAAMDILAGQKGLVTWFGEVTGLNTSAWNVGDVLYASPTVAGALTNVKPTVPNLTIPVAAVLVKDAAAGVLMVRPTLTLPLAYGAFSDTTTQVPAVANTPQAVTFNTTDSSNKVVVGTPASRIVCQSAGHYNFQFSAQVRSTNAASQSLFIWPRINGIDVPNSATEITIKSNSDVIVPSWNFQLSMQANDYFELIWASAATTSSLAATVAQTTPYVRPAIPSIILTVNQINQ